MRLRHVDRGGGGDDTKERDAEGGGGEDDGGDNTKPKMCFMDAPHPGGIGVGVEGAADTKVKLAYQRADKAWRETRTGDEHALKLGKGKLPGHADEQAWRLHYGDVDYLDPIESEGPPIWTQAKFWTAWDEEGAWQVGHLGWQPPPSFSCSRTRTPL